MLTFLKKISLPLLCITMWASSLHAQDKIAQTLSISTHFKLIVDKPSWLLELRDMESGQVLPYLFDIRDNDNFFLAFSKERSYRVTASVLKFGPYATIKNFCHLEDGILTGKSMFITITGVLSPDPTRTVCRVRKFNQTQFTVVSQEETSTQRSYSTSQLNLSGSTVQETTKTTTSTTTSENNKPAVAPPPPPQRVIEDRGITIGS